MPESNKFNYEKKKINNKKSIENLKIDSSL